MFVIDSQVKIACRDINPEIFFSRRKRDIAEAKAFCRSCPIMLACLENALEFEKISGERQHGVQGGLTEAERAQTTLRRIDGTSIHREEATHEQGLRAATG